MQLLKIASNAVGLHIMRPPGKLAELVDFSLFTVHLLDALSRPVSCPNNRNGEKTWAFG
ncbi:MAG TPA: hypothetical protein PKD64_16495 [Pirellulaceae bacterium]|nr:hypothetical protein [Pirellulaceae bacterium]HMO93790.1 hypothetical protein [Pirellulaceae bacterium]HMP70616.1 hypothetical protein [Pirellulaceae bacterium]